MTVEEGRRTGAGPRGQGALLPAGGTGEPVAGGAGDGAPDGGGGQGDGAAPKRARRTLLAALLSVLAVLAAFGSWLHGQADPAGSPGASVIVTVTPGESTTAVVAALARDGVLGSPFAFRIWSILRPPPVIQPGEYQVRRHSSFGSVMNVLANGPDVFSVTIPPGFTVAETAGRLGQLPGRDPSAFLSLVSSGAVRSPWEPAGRENLDGLLAPGTYTVLPGESDEQVLEAMIAGFDRMAASVDLLGRAAALGVTPYQAITVASIVEKEGVIPVNEGKVARVVYNRLAVGMPLQMDSTVLYAEGRDGGPVTAADEQVRSPYNTYLNRGLTPTPTCIPSRAALEAALDPTPGGWLFFVVVEPDGTEAFSDTFAGQRANEALAAGRGLG